MSTVWSFSRLSLFEECPRAYYFTYCVEPRLEELPNAYSEYGTLGHALLDEYAMGFLLAEELGDEYDKRYLDYVRSKFPPFPKGYAEKAYSSGLEYFKNFTGYGEQYEIISSEQKFTTEIAGHKFTGIVDLILKDKATGGFIVVDHKSKSLSRMKADKKKYMRQLYLYCTYIQEKYGVFPTELRFNLFKEGGAIVSEPFDETTYHATVQWMVDLIQEIEGTTEYPEKDKNDMFCQYICGARRACGREAVFVSQKNFISEPEDMNLYTSI